MPISPEDIAQIARELETHPSFGVDPGRIRPGEEPRLIGATGEPAYQNSYASGATGNFRGACFWKFGNIVYLGGQILVPVTIAVAFTLPVGYRPSATCVFVTGIGNGGTGGTTTDVTISTIDINGTVIVDSPLSPADLDGIFFFVP